MLTFNATLWMVVVYLINNKWTIGKIPFFAIDLLLLSTPVILSLISIWLSKFFGKDDLDICEEFCLADNEFLPTYLGYFFLAVGVSNNCTMIIVYVIVFIFTFLSQTQYFNPMYLLLGYHYYHVLTSRGTRVFIICRGNVLRKKDDISFNYLRRINDTTYIEKR